MHKQQQQKENAVRGIFPSNLKTKRGKNLLMSMHGYIGHLPLVLFLPLGKTGQHKDL